MSNGFEMIKDIQDNIHNSTMENIHRYQNDLLNSMAKSTNNLAIAQNEANRINEQTLSVLKSQLSELKRKNDSLEDENKNNRFHNRIMLIIAIVSALIALVSMIVQFIR